jgi:hypothetical protein
LPFIYLFFIPDIVSIFIYKNVKYTKHFFILGSE